MSPGPALESGKKRRRRGGTETQKKRRRQEQRGLCELNVDELYIIFAYNYPMDLLNLARTCKYLRGILMHKSSLFLWKAALSRVENLPSCPADLTEPEYTNLAFYPRCHGCSKPAHTILWKMRRRYCPACRAERLCSVSSYYEQTEALDWTLPADSCKVGNDSGVWVDKDQVESFMREYHQSSDKEAFLDGKRKQYRAISLHAGECEYWRARAGRRVHRHDLEVLRKERVKSIFERLRQHGYGPEIAYFREDGIERTYKSTHFKRHNPLTDNEWDQMWPEWAKIMNDFRIRRLRSMVYQPRRRSLVSAYDEYVAQSNTPTFDLLPYVADIACLPPFQDVIEASEEAPFGRQLFASALSQLPALVGEWKKQVDIDLAELVHVPPHLSLEDRTVACSSTASGKSYQTDLDKLRLACAVFHRGGHDGLLLYPDVFFIGIRQSYPPCNEDSDKHVGILDRLGIQIMEEAPYIVRACGLDPNVATPDDMDRRNARLRCLYCNTQPIIIENWRGAMMHTQYCHRAANSVPECSRWQIIDDKHISIIQAIEESLKKENMFNYVRCLLCQPRIGDSWRHYQFTGHLQKRHGVDTRDVKQGVHYEHLGIMNGCKSIVEMIEEGGHVVFRQPQYRHSASLKSR